MSNPYRPLFRNELGTLAAQKRRANTERERLLHALALVEEAITSLVPLVQDQYPRSPCNKAYALLIDASQELRARLK